MAEYIYRGKTQSEISTMDIKDIAQLLNSRERRKIIRGFTEAEKKLLKKIKETKDKNALIRTRARDMIVLPEMFGRKLGIYNGLEYVVVEIRPEMLGHRLGEFALTRKKVKHSSPGFGATRSSKFVPLK